MGLQDPIFLTASRECDIKITGHGNGTIGWIVIRKSDGYMDG